MTETRLPSLNALRAFEAAARHGSLSQAAAELHVTHSAVSHQIKALEAELGVTLFRRVGRGVAANAIGQQLEAALSDAFAPIGRAVLQARHGDRAGIVTISVEPSFAIRWLVLRLGRFRAANPEIDLRLSATADLADFSREDVDVAIRHGRGGWPGLDAERLMDARVSGVQPEPAGQRTAAVAARGPSRSHAAARGQRGLLAGMAGGGGGGRGRGRSRAPLRRWPPRRWPPPGPARGWP